MIFKDVKMLRICRVAALIREISARCITQRAKFKNFNDDFKNSRTFQGYSKILTKIQGPFKDFKDQHKIQGFFQGCGNPVSLSLKPHIGKSHNV